MRAINLNKELPCEYLCHQIQLLINDYKKDNPTQHDCVLVMNIQQIGEANISTPISLLEHKEGWPNLPASYYSGMRVDHTHFNISPQSSSVDNSTHRFYTNQENSEFLDANGFYRSNNDGDNVFAKAVKDKLSKNITNRNLNYSYYIKASPNKILHDARKLYSLKEENDHAYIDNVCKSDQSFIQVTESIFNKYINFLKTNNVQWLNQAQREVK